MAGDRVPSPADARIPCPQCGALIHPIAGRCKHCKHDLSAGRNVRPHAAAALPALQAPAFAPLAAPQPTAAPPPAVAPQPPNLYANGHANGNGHYMPHAAAAPAYAPYQQPAQMPVAPAQLRYHDPTQPILPPRPTGRMPAAPRSSSGWWKSWPVIVIILAALAIVTAVVLMVWPPGGASDKPSTGLKPPPAPERMDTNPLPPPTAQNGTTPRKTTPSTPDPWDDKSDPSAPKPKIDIPDDPTPGGPDKTVAMSANILKHACDRFKACGLDDDLGTTICEAALTRAPSMPVPSCAAARRCLSSVDAMSCTAVSDPNEAATLATQLSDCVDAMRC